MNVLVLNGGSSSIKFSLFAMSVAAQAEADQECGMQDPSLLLDGEVAAIGTPQAMLAIVQRGRPSEQRTIGAIAAPAEAIGIVLDAIQSAEAGAVDAVGYRVVHPGNEIEDHVRITEEILKKLEAAASFAPLHDPDALAIIRATIQRMPHVPQIACFDSVFHRTMPEEASTYAIPKQYRDQGAKRYGFHGLSCESIVRQMRRMGTLPARMVIAHLGSGCSVTALLNGVSIDTTMGLTPTGGIVMGTRPGDLDPGLMLYLSRQEQSKDAARNLEQMLNHNSGIVAFGLPNDMKAVRKAAAEGDNAAILALKIFTRSVRKAIGGFAWLMGGLDTIVFTGGIGQHDGKTRIEVVSGTDASIDSALNDAKEEVLHRISLPNAKTSVFVAPAQEDLVIALHVKRILG